MDKELEIILGQLGKQIDDSKDSLSREMRGGLKGVRAHVDANYETLSQKLEKSEGRVDKIEDETNVWRILQRNPVVSVPILLIFLAVIIALVDRIGLVNLIK